MECEDNEYVRSEAAAIDGSLGVKRRRHAAESDLQLDVTIAMPSASHGKPMHSYIVPPLENNCQKVIFTNTPFMNNMDEISYWVHTKRAPCLYTYDQINIKHKEQAHCSNLKPKNNILREVPSPKKRNKRKLISVEDDTVSTEHEPAANFFTCNGRRKPAKNNCRISSIGSDIDFIIKESSTQMKPKRMRLERKSKRGITKKHINKFASSTPKVGTLRRSLRKLQKTLDNPNLESTMENFNNNTALGSLLPENITQDDFTKPSENNHNINANEINAASKNCDNLNDKSKQEMVPNGQFEDVSDVSGFTANYIRSTKIHSNKSSRNFRNKLKKSNVKQTSEKQGSKTVMCVNKSINTGLADSAVLNCSTDSSQNIINVVTLKTNEKLARVNRATSLLKFMDTKTSDSKQSLTNIDSKDYGTANISEQSNGTSRYPKRYKNNMTGEPASVPSKIEQSKCPSGRRKKTCKNSSECNNSDRKENPEEEFVTRTRSGRKIGLKVRQAENTVLVLSNSTEISSITAVNVAGPTENNASDESKKKTRRSCRAVQEKKSADRSRQTLRKDSLKEKSGFSACFSESDEDVKPVKQGKFFC